MPISLADLIARVPAEVELKVKRVRDQARPVLQEALRTECRLVLRTPEETEQSRHGAQVPIEVLPGHPEILRDLTFPDDFERIMLLGRYRSSLEQARTGAIGLLKLREELEQLPDPGRWVRATAADLLSTANWATSLLALLDQHDPLKTVLAVRRDFLGVYECDPRTLFDDEYMVNRATIRIYWGIIGLVTEWMGCTVDDLTVVVLTHELGHAYSQLGADIQGRRWPARAFALAEPALIEGLAQYYTERVLRRLERRYAGALKVFYSMLLGQPEAYRGHETWINEYSPEAVRRAMLEVRIWKERRLDEFNQRLKSAQVDLQPDDPTP